MKKAVPLSWLIVGLGMAGCGASDTRAPQATSGERSSPREVVLTGVPTGVRTAVVAVRSIADVLQVPARIEPDPARVIRIFAPVSGRLIAVEVRPGDRVRMGQTLAQVESSEVSSARADYQKARADAEVKEKSLRRASLLYENKVFAEKDYQQAQAEAEMAEAELNRTLDRLQVLGVEPEGSSNRLRVVAPRAGVVLEVGAAPGELSKSLDSPQPLCTLADLSSVWALGEVLEADLSGLRPGTPAEVTVNAYPTQKWNARVAAVSDVVDALTHTVKLRVVLSNLDGRLKPQMFAFVRLTRSEARGLVVPVAAVIHEGARSFVFVQTSAGRYERRLVTLGRTTESGIEVTSGLQPGEAVVAEGALLLRAAIS